MLRNHFEVEDIQNRAKSIFANNSTNLIITQLQNLQSNLLKYENQFYSMIGKTKEQFQQDYTNAYQALGTIQGILLQIENDFVLRYTQPKSVLDKDQTVQKFLEKINQDLQSDPELVREIKDFGASAVDTVLSMLANDPNAKVTFSKTTKRKTPFGVTQVGLGRLQLKIDKHRQAIVQKVRTDNDLITDDYIKRMEAYLGNEIEKQKLDKQEFVNEVIEELNARGLSKLSSMASLAGTRIDVNGSAASIRGYFGELYALAALESLYGTKAQIMHTGSIRKASSGQQIPIDIILIQGMQQFNFQVKNYQIKNGKIKLNGTTSAVNFIHNRLMMTGNVAEILTWFFASYQFNQPFTGKIAALFDNSPMTVPEYDAQVYQEFQNIFNEISYNFNQWALNIFKIEDIFSASSGGIFTNEQSYFNHFFIVKDRVIPASDIIQQIINGLQNNVPITSFTLVKPKNTSETLQGHFNDRSYSPPIYPTAALTDIRYSITITV